jgi:glycerol-3-phosphate dehydrogenase (NAD(P)+)
MEHKMKVGIIGAGAWGTALAMIAARAGNQAVLWAYKNSEEINQKHRNSWLPGVVISREITVTSKFSDLSDADIWLVAVPTEFFIQTMRKSRPFWSKQGKLTSMRPIIICAKGIEPKTGKLLSDVISEILPGSEKFIGVLSGPQFAKEAALGAPTGSTIAGNAKVRNAARQALGGLYLEDSDDISGVQICGAGKNALAILVGYLDGQGASENERALKLTLAWQELIAFSRPFRAKMKTFGMLCGIGDLLLAVAGKTSRNYSAGIALAKNRPISGTLEGLAALDWIVRIAKKNKISMPILEKLHLAISKNL